jgi:predicted nucleic acid-binding protein
MQSYMFDTNLFNCILDGVVEISKFRRKARFYATHVQLDELKATSNVQRRQDLLAVFEEVVGINKIPTEAFVLDVSLLDEAKLGDEEDDLYSQVKMKLDKRNRNKPNNIQDALITETAMKNGLTLATHDSDLFFVATKMGAACVNVHQIELELNSQNNT